MDRVSNIRFDAPVTRRWYAGVTETANRKPCNPPRCVVAKLTAPERLRIDQDRFMYTMTELHDIPEDDKDSGIRRADPRVAAQIEDPNPITGDVDSILQKANCWARSQKPAIRSADGDRKLQDVADGLIGGHALSLEQAGPIFAEYNGRCIPPRSASEIEKRLKIALDKVVTDPDIVGWLLEPEGDADSGRGRETREDNLLNIINGMAELWHTSDKRSFATVEVDGAKENFEIDPEDFGFWLNGIHLNCFGDLPSENQLKNALYTAKGLARLRGPKHKTSIRIAEKDERVYVDLYDKDRRAVEIDAHGWRIVTDAPVKFVRPAGMLELPAPVPGGTIDELRSFVPVSSPEDFMLFVGYLVMCFSPNGPYPALMLNGQQGTGKSTMSRLCGEMVDPREAQLQSMPKDVQDLAISAANNAIVAVDNVSYVSADMSDALCKLSTGAAFMTRKLYTNNQLSVIKYCRPLILNGIGDVATRADLLDRGILIELDKIAKRKREKKFWLEFQAALPRILGALFNGVSGALKSASSIPDDDLPRMADFAQWAIAAGTAFGWEPGAFLAAYQDNIAKAVTLALDQHPIVPVLRAFAEDNEFWTGSMTELLGALSNEAAGTDARRAKNWPGSASALSNLLKRLAPALAATGVGVDIDRMNGGKRLRYVELTFKSPTGTTVKLADGSQQATGRPSDGSRLLTY